MTRRLAQTLLEAQLVGQSDVEEAMQRQVLFGGSLGTNLLEAGIIEESVLIDALGRTYAQPTAGKDDIDAISPHIPRLFPQVFAESYHLVPYELEGSVLRVLVTGQPDRQLMDRIHERLALSVSPVITSELRLHYAMNQLYGAELLPRFKELLSKLDGTTVVHEPAARKSSAMLSWGVSGAPLASPKRRSGGGLSVRELLARLEFATSRDEIIQIFLDAVMAIFDYAALFVVQGEFINGWRAAGESQDRIAQISLPVELPSVFQTIYATRGHYLGPLPKNSVNERLLEQMGREAPRAAFVAPLIIGNKLAMMIYADNGARGISPRRVQAVLLLSQRATVAFERLIRKRKASASNISAASGGDDWSDDVSLEFDLAADGSMSEEVTELEQNDFEVVAENPVARTAPREMGVVSRDEVSFVEIDESPQANRAAFERGVDEHAERDAELDDDYVAFADIEDSEQENLDGWGDVLVETADALGVDVIRPTTRTTPARGAPPSVTWDDVVQEALAAGNIMPRVAPTSIEVAGTVVDETEILLDGVEASDAQVRREAIERISKLGENAFEAIARRFPGQLHFDPFDTKTRVPPFPQLSGITELLFSQGSRVASIVLPFLEDDDRVKRFVAIYFMLAVRYPPGLDTLARRLYDSEPRNRHLAADALRTYGNESSYRRIVESVRAQLEVPVVESQITAAQLLGQLRDPASVPELIPLVVSPKAELARAATSSLAVLCAQEFGHDVPAWSDWWRQNYNRPRPVWLIQGLRHESLQMRRIANYELQLMTGMTTHFDADAPPEEREEKTQMWENWWVHFARSRQRQAAGAGAKSASEPGEGADAADEPSVRASSAG